MSTRHVLACGKMHSLLISKNLVRMPGLAEMIMTHINRALGEQSN